MTLRRDLLNSRMGWIISGVLPLAVFTVVITGLFTQQQEKNMRRSIQTSAYGIAHMVDRQLVEQIGLLNALAASRSLDSGDFTSFRLDAQQLWGLHPEWRTVILTDEHKPILNLRFPPGEPITPLRDADSLEQVWETARPCVGNLAHGYVAIRVPVFRNGGIVHTLVAPMDPSVLDSLLTDSMMSAQWGGIVVGSDDVIIAASPKASLNRGDLLPIQVAGKKNRDPSGVSLMYAEPVSINSGNWRVLVFAPADVIEMPFYMKRAIVYLAGVAAVVITVVLMLVLSLAWAEKQDSVRLRNEIRERTEAQKALQASESHYRAVVEDMPVLVLSFLPGGTITFANRVYCDYFNKTPDELIGSTFLSQIPESDQGTVLAAIASLTVQSPSQSHENQVVVPGGEIRWNKWTTRAFFDAAGHPLSYQAIGEDITRRKGAESALRKSEENYRRIFENSIAGIFQSTPQGRFTSVNPRFASMLGYESPDDLIASITDISIEYYVNPEDRTHYKTVLQENGSIENFEFRVKRKNGSELWVSNSTRAFFDKSGNVGWYEGVVIDIDSRKQAESTLLRQTSLLKGINRIFHHALTGETEQLLGETCLAVAQEVTESAFGLIGQTETDILASSLIFSSSSMDACRIGHQKGEHGLGGESEAHSICGRIISKGETFLVNNPDALGLPGGHPVLRSFLGVPLLQDDRVTGMIAVGNRHGGYGSEQQAWLESLSSVIMEVFRRKRAEVKRQLAEEALRESEKRLVESQRIARTGDFVWHVETGEVTLSQAGHDLLLSDKTGSVDFTWLMTQVHHPGDAGRISQWFSRCIEEGKGELTPCEYRMVQRNGEILFVRTVGVIKQEPGQGTRVFGTFQDITWQKQMEAEQEKLHAQLAQAQKLESVGRLAGGVAHDYNNMLSVIIGNAELALEQVDPDSGVHDDIMEIHTAATRSMEITRQLLAFARQQTVAPKALDLNETVENSLKMLRRLIGEDINLAWHPHAGIWSVKMDPGQVDQILANLCINARDAISGVGKIVIETDACSFGQAYCDQHTGFTPGDFVMLAISDDGCGMTADTLDNIFEPFFTTKEVGQGTGLGLATVYGIVRQNNGFINVYSEPDTGTTFRIYLPRYKGVDIRENTPVSRTIPGGQGETVLVVEDEGSILKLAGRILEDQGYRVLLAGTPRQALVLADTHTTGISLLITDLIMPEMNGRDLAEEIRKRSPGIKCLFMSGYTSQVIASHGVLEEGLHFIQKPFSKEDLAAKVRSTLDFS